MTQDKKRNEATNLGITVQDRWAAYSGQVLKITCRESAKDLELAFYAGAISASRIIATMLVLDDSDLESVKKAIYQIGNEVMQHAARHAADDTATRSESSLVQ